MASPQWSELTRDARRLENSLENQIQLYSNLNSSLNDGDEENPLLHDTDEESEVARDIEQLLASLADCNDKMSQNVSRNPRVANSALLQRYREILFDYSTEFKKTQDAIRRKRESAALFRMADESRDRRSAGTSEMDHLLRERGAIANAQRGTDSVIGQALATREALRHQRQLFSGITAKISDLSTSFPVVNRVIEGIRKKKLQDNIVLAAVIASCVCFTLWWLFA